MINWKVRIKNKNFWITLIPAIIVFIQLVANLFGFSFNLDDIGNKIIAIIDALFVILSIIGIVNDPTTESLNDSKQALTYTAPKVSIDTDQEEEYTSGRGDE